MKSGVTHSTEVTLPGAIMSEIPSEGAGYSMIPAHLMEDPNAVAVFGSNTKGRHGAGMALMCKQLYGAIYGFGIGIQGKSYAIPTKDGNFHNLRDPRARLPLIDIELSVNDWMWYAEHHPEKKFYVGRIGCGLAGNLDSEIAPLFTGSPANCWFDPLWKPYGLKSWADLP
jgi:hypothetical protein